MVNKRSDKYSKTNDKKSNYFNPIFNLNKDDGDFKEEALFVYNAINEGQIDLSPTEKKELLQELDLILNHFGSENNNLDNISKSSDIKDNLNSKNNLCNKNQNSSNLGNHLNSLEDSCKSTINNSLQKDSSDDIADNMIEKKNNDSKESISYNSSSDEVVDELYCDGVSHELVDDSSIGVSSEDLVSVVDEESLGGDIGDDSEDLSVDDALHELVDDFSIGVSSEDLVSVVDEESLGGDIGDDSEDLSGDDILIELIDDEISSEDLVSVVDEESLGGDIGDDSEDLSVDDALNDLIVNYSDDVAIKVENVSMEFKVSKDKIDTFKEFFIKTIKRDKSDTVIVTALHNVSFEIPKGDRVGIIGFNGAGKSTLLKVLSGVYDATEGTIETKGKIAPLLELGAGFDFNYSGKDNIFLNGAFLGYSEDFLKEKYDEIVEFSELGEAINYPVKTYSSGMRAKLGFAIATIVEPDILILDEILSVGDIRFKKKSADKIRSLINSGITVLLVSHSVSQIRDLCNKAIWIDNGELKLYGEVNEVCDAYTKAANNATKEQLENIKLD